ncbi:tetratricopeptide repeat protein [Actinotalea sp. M2MS4P-6]|uniref:tetratricopeptide repeat protein n=1 Tax=Actinotalea sp. M2MS4P-6 TaxID=2983762 RepID=UPI0021E439F0|nr:tetratricopeptide repeat protein [Actinotalea sp. M2MS4P-6]MCV2394775.1 tetratricopeptide repeat protein [Actinotalea sp. M2MS4P-6]
MRGARRPRRGPFEVLDDHVEDLDRAVHWAVGHDPDLALRIVGGAWEWCYLRGRYAQGRAWTALALAAAPQAASSGAVRAALRARALQASGTLAFLQCDYAVATDQVEECLALSRDLGDTAGQCWALGRLGSIARERGRYQDARRRHEDALHLARAADDVRAECGQLTGLSLAAWLSGDLALAARFAAQAVALVDRIPPGEPAIWSAINTGVIARLSGRLEEADALLARGYELSEQHLFPEGMAWTLNQRGVVARERGDLDRSARLQEVALAEHRRLGDRWREASALEELGLLAALRGDVAVAASRLVEAERVRAVIGAPVPPAERAVRERAGAMLTRSVG